VFIAYHNKKHKFNWFNTLHVIFTISGYTLWWWYRPVYICAFILCVSYSGLQCNKHNSYWYVEQLVGYLIPWTNYMHLYCVSDSGILCNKHNSYWYVEQLVGFLIPWTNYMHLYCVSDSGLLCNKHNSYWYVEQLVGFLIPWTNSMHLYCVSDSGLLCNKHNSYWYEGQHLDRQTALGSLYEPWNW
jgi:hypothetical protein